MQLSTTSFAIFVYPFSFDRACFDDLVAAADRDELDAGSGNGWRVWDRGAFPQDDLLRHVSDYLNPAPDVPPTACLWTLQERVRTSPKGLGLRAGALSLWLGHRRRGGVGGETAAIDAEAAIGLAVDSVDLALFRVGLGYLMFRVRIASTAPEDWYDALNGLRYIDRPGQVELVFQRRTGKDRVEPFFPPLANCPEQAASGRGAMLDLIRGLLGRLALAEADWWRELFVPRQLLAFHALFFVDGPESRPAHEHEHEQALVLYRLRNFFRTGQPLVPSADDLRPDHPALLSYAERMWFSVTLEGGGFVAFDAPDTPFWAETMPAHLREQYFLLFLLALHQRFALMSLSDQVCARWLTSDDARAEADFAELREALLEFTARGYFSQVMQREHHHRCFRAWQEVFECERLFREVNDEVRELHGMLLMRKTERLQQLAEEQRYMMNAQAQAETKRERAAQRRSERLGLWFGVVAFLLGFPSLVLGYLQLIGVTDGLVALRWLGLSVAVGGALMLAVHLWIRRQRE